MKKEYTEEEMDAAYDKGIKEGERRSSIPKLGDKVEIIGNIPHQLKDKPKPLLGTVVDADGAYIYVKPKYQRYECEFYACELKKL